MSASPSLSALWHQFLYQGRKVFRLQDQSRSERLTWGLSGVLLGLCGVNTVQYWPAPLTSPFLGGLLQTVMELLGALGFAAGLGAVLFLLAHVFECLRRPVVFLLEILADMPALAGVGLLLFYSGAPFLTVCVVAGGSLGTRSLLAGFQAIEKLPQTYLQTVESLRLTERQVFQHVRLPLALPAMLQGAVQDFPDFWVRLFGAQILLYLLGQHQDIGWGSTALMAWKAGQNSLFMQILLATACLTLLFHQVVTRRMRQFLRRRDLRRLSLPLLPAETSRPLAKAFLLQRSVLGFLGLAVGGVLLLGVTHQITHLLLPSLRFFLEVAAVIALVGFEWFVIGCFSLGWQKRIYEGLKNTSTFGALFPLFLLYPFLCAFIFTFPLLLWLSCQGIMGVVVLRGTHTLEHTKHVSRASGLNLPFSTDWQHIRAPLVIPTIFQGIQVLWWSAWNPALLALLATVAVQNDHVHGDHVQGLGRLVNMLEGSHPVPQLFFLFVLTLLIFGVRSFLITPWKDYFFQKYRLFP